MTTLILITVFYALIMLFARGVVAKPEPADHGLQSDRKLQ